MAVRQLAFVCLTALVVLGVASPSAAAHRRGDGLRRMLRLLHAQALFERIAVCDVDNDGDLDIVAAPAHGPLRVWRNAGKGRFALASLPRATYHTPAHSPRYVRSRSRPEDGGLWGDSRDDVALPRAITATAAILPLALVRQPEIGFVPPASLQRVSGRAPPVS